LSRLGVVSHAPAAVSKEEIMRAMLIRARAVVALALVAALAMTSGATALDPRYADTDGDMVADTPLDHQRQSDPPVLIFAYSPIEDPAVYAKVWEGFLRHLEKLPGKRVQYFPVQSHAAQIEAMRAGRLHVAAVGTGAVPLAVTCAGFVPITIMAAKDGDYGYSMEIVTHPDSPLTRPEDLKGKGLAFTSESSNSGYKAPSALLREKFGLEAGKDYAPVFSGKHDNSILGVVNKDYPAAAISSSVRLRMEARNVIKPGDLKVIYRSGRFPTNAFGYAHNLAPALQEKIRQAFFTFDWKDSGLLNEFGKNEPPGEQFIPITYREHWEVVREVDRALGVKYECR
jgi:phosphonate transport system substrate-binding protein